MAVPGAPAFLEEAGEKVYDLSFLVITAELTPTARAAQEAARLVLKTSPVHDFHALQRHLQQVRAEPGVALSLDASQQQAFCAAMTREVVLIQGRRTLESLGLSIYSHPYLNPNVPTDFSAGPPGTGKSYIEEQVILGPYKQE
jgi:hypothetical protein